MAQVGQEEGTEHYPHLEKGGQYGPGLEHEAECEIVTYQWPSEKEPKVFGKTCPREDFCHFRIRVRSEEFGAVTLFIDEPITPRGVAEAGRPGRMGQWLTNLGVNVGPAPTYLHDDEEPIGKQCGVVVGDPRQGDDGRWFNGNVTDILGV